MSKKLSLITIILFAAIVFLAQPAKADQLGSINIVDVSQDGISAHVYAVGNWTKADTQKLMLAVWSCDDQSNIVWYDMSFDDYCADVIVSTINHKLELGTYHMHLYHMDMQGTLQFIEGKDVSLRGNDAIKNTITGEWSADNRYYKATISNAYEAKNSEYLAAVWSETNGQDDLKWLTMSSSGAYSFAVNIRIGDFKSPGDFHIHIYRRTNGEMFFLNATDFEVPIYNGRISQVNVAEDKISATAYIDGDWDAEDNCTFSLAVWSTANQSNLVWYNVDAKDGAGSLSFDIANHGYELGTYHLHLYITTPQGLMYFLGGVDAEITGNSGERDIINGTWSADKMSYKVVLSGTQYVAKSEYYAAVWSDINGQDDLKWLPLQAIGTNTFATDIIISDFKSPGVYHVHMYRKTGGAMYFLNAYNFEVPIFSGGIISVGLDDTLIGANALIEGDWTAADNCSFSLAIWSTYNQSNLVWYKVDAKNGTGEFSFDIANHGYERGTYHLHLYITNTQGQMYFLNGVDVEISGNPGESDIINGNWSADNLYYHAVLSNATYIQGSQYYAAVWSALDGQDDLKWISMNPRNADTIVADIKTTDFSSPGIYYIHMYRVTNGTYNFIGGVEVELKRNAGKAMAQIIELGSSRNGYLEKSKTAYDNNHSIVYELTAGAGSDNYAECWEDTKPIQLAGVGQGGAWCCNFVYWLFYKPFGEAQAAAALYLNDWKSSSPWQYFSCTPWYNNFVLHGKSYSAKDCQAGDIIFFTISHMGLVYKVDDTYIYTIEGNTSSIAGVEPNGGCVRLKRYSKTYSSIKGFGRPDYSVLG